MIKSFLSFLLIIFLFLSSLGVVASHLRSPLFIVQQAQSIDLYSRLAENIPSLVPAETLQHTRLTKPEVTSIITSSISGDDFYQFLSQVLTAYLPWLTGQAPTVSYQFDLTPIKNRLVTQASTVIKTKYQALPTCHADQLRNWSFESSVPACQLPAGTITDKSLDNQISQLAATTVNLLPDQLTSTHSSPTLDKIKRTVSLAAQAIKLIWLITAGLVLLLLMGWRSRAFISLALTFLIVGLLEVAFSFVGWDWLTKTISDWISGLTNVKSILPIGLDLIAVIIQAMKNTFSTISFGLIGGGIALLIAGVVSKIHAATKIAEKI